VKIGKHLAKLEAKLAKNIVAPFSGTRCS